MDISSLTGITSDYLNTYAKQNSLVDTSEDSFDSILSSMMNSLTETNDLQNAAESAEIQFALGESSNTHDLLIAESKAEVALQYTVAVRDKIIDAYKELMQMSI
jgi:flagellar hook-basal body complex protein FliE